MKFYTNPTLPHSNPQANCKQEDCQQENLPYEHCPNCGAELKGKYCHVCGQKVACKTITIFGFIVEYINHAFIWDSNFFKTLWTLISRPGHLTNEFLAKKFNSYEHPLKLNMFLLLVFISLFVIFNSSKKMTDSVEDITTDERIFSSIQLSSLINNQEYAKKIQESPRDTILLQAPLLLAKNYPEIISNLETKEDTNGEALDKWVAVVPQVLIDDKIIIADNSGYYIFNKETKASNDILLVNHIWSEMVDITSKYFPTLLLLTAPFLSLALSLVERKKKRPNINHFIFSLHYTAFIETLIICIYILHLIFSPSMRILEYTMIIGSCTYLSIAFRKVYEINSWGKAIAKSLLTSLIYFIILLSIFIVIFLIASFIAANNTLSELL